MTHQPHSAISPPHAFVPPAGTEWFIDAQGCQPADLCELDRILRICQDVIDDLGLKVIGQPLSHRFPSPGGVTAMYLLSESHLTCHTYPEHALATFNLYCCRHRPQWHWNEELQQRLGASAVLVRSQVRGEL